MSTAVTAVGMITSVGHDAVTACAAIRAGIARPAPVPEKLVLDLESGEEVPLTGHPVSGIGDGFSGAARWLQLAPIAIEDLCASGGLPDARDREFWSRTVLFIALPYLDEARFFDDPLCLGTSVVDGFISPLKSRLASLCWPGEIRTLCRGRVGAMQALERGRRWIDEQRCDRVILLAVDSLLDGQSLAFLDMIEQLKTDMRPTGLSPGEAAAAIMIEGDAAADARGKAALARLGPIATGVEENAFLSAQASQGAALFESLNSCLSQAGVGQAFDGDIVSDHNGQYWRANEIGFVQARAGIVDWTGVRQVMPATSVGDPGAAFSVLQCVVAARALQRGYGSRRGAIVTSSDEHGPVSSVFFGVAA